MSSLDRRNFLKTTAAGLATLAGAPGTVRGAAASRADDDPLGVRADFPITGTGLAYLDSAAVCPIPRAVREAGVEYLDNKMLKASRVRNADKADEARSRFAELFGAAPEEVALLYSTSDGENIVASALDLEPGDNVVVDELHFTTSFVLYRQLERNKGIALRIVPHRDGRTRLEDYEARIDGRTRLVSVAWVSNRNGFRQDLRALSERAHAKGAFVYADAVQALGHFPTRLEEQGVDALCSGAYKWLLASFGVAAFYVRKEHFDRIRPDRYGHAQVERSLPDFRFELHDDAKKYEYAALGYGPVYQLNAGLEYLMRVGLANIERHTNALARELREGIAALGWEPFTPPENPSPIVSFEHGRDPEEVRNLLEEEEVVVTLREEGKVLRAGVALFNHREDVGRLLRALKRMA